MIGSLEWLKDYTDLNVSPEEFCEKMIMSGSNLETMEHVGADMEKVVVGKITKIEKHPDADKLVVLTDIEGLYKDINDKSSFISRLTADQADALIGDGFIGGGMLPKLNNCTSAIRNGVNRVHILDGRIPHCLLLEIFTNEGIGTAIVKDDEEL